ncbi:DUF1638 domain-containing protein [Clostridia bacterium]|nr:DUF1638 domain-containing protein [Clostridia bacterium]
MKTLLIACETLKEELLFVITEGNIHDLDIEWVDGGLHENPEKLQNRIQSLIENYDGVYDFILLGYGYCGGGIKDLISKKSTLIVPKVSDCISLLLGSEKVRMEINERDHPFFMTKGWARCMDQVGILCIQRIKDKYGYEKTSNIFQQMFSGYKAIDVIETGCYSMAEVREKVDELNDLIGLPENIIEGDLNIILALLSKNWNTQFIIKQPGEAISQNDFELDSLS